jgi:hypothetical protein
MAHLCQLLATPAPALKTTKSVRRTRVLGGQSLVYHIWFGSLFYMMFLGPQLGSTSSSPTLLILHVCFYYQSGFLPGPPHFSSGIYPVKDVLKCRRFLLHRLCVLHALLFLVRIWCSSLSLCMGRMGGAALSSFPPPPRRPHPLHNHKILPLGRHFGGAGACSHVAGGISCIMLP